MGKAGLEPINPRRIEGPPRPMQPKSSQKVKRVACVLKRSVERQLKRGKCTDPQMLDQKSNDWRSIFLWLNIVLNLKRK